MASKALKNKILSFLKARIEESEEGVAHIRYQDIQSINEGEKLNYAYVITTVGEVCRENGIIRKRDGRYGSTFSFAGTVRKPADDSLARDKSLEDARRMCAELLALAHHLAQELGVASKPQQTFDNDSQASETIEIPEEDVFMRVPAKFGREFIITKRMRDNWAQEFRNVDVNKELTAARVWSIEKPDRMKTVTGMQRFLRSWLIRSATSVRGATSNGMGARASLADINAAHAIAEDEEF